jgi:hypothetical protein
MLSGIIAIVVCYNRVCKCQGLLSMYRNLTTGYDLEPPLRDWDAEVKQLVKVTSKLNGYSNGHTNGYTNGYNNSSASKSTAY